MRHRRSLTLVTIDMCTVTMIPLAEGRLRVACNRDERRTRPRAVPPHEIVAGNRMALCPIDAGSGGTWIAVNDMGMIFTLLNVNAESDVTATRPVTGHPTRGEIIVKLLAAATHQEAITLAVDVDGSQYRPFRLLVVDGVTLVELAPGHRGIEVVQIVRVESPQMFTSSSLGDSVVEPPRRELFHQLFRDAAIDDFPALQDEFHRHQWPESPHLSVDMQRADAETVSMTIIEPNVTGSSMRYVNGHPSFGLPAITRSLPFRHMVRR